MYAFAADKNTVSRATQLGDTEQIYSEAQQKAFIEECHNDADGHMGTTQTLCRLKERDLWWPNQAATVHKYVQACDLCQNVRGDLRTQLTKRYAPLHRSAGMIEWTIDHMTDLPESEHGFHHVLVIIDSFTRFVWLIPTKTVNTQEVVEALYSLMCRFGIPTQLRSDNHKAFTSKQLAIHLAKLLKFNPFFTIPYDPETHALVERANREVVRHLRALTFRDTPANWPQMLPLVERIMNSSISFATGFAPYALVFGTSAYNRHIETLDEPEPDQVLQALSDLPTQPAAFQKKLDQVLATLTIRSLEHQDQQLTQRAAKAPARPNRFAIGDLVLWRPAKATRPHKLAPIFYGPGHVIAQEHDTVTIAPVMDPTSTVIKNEAHVRRLLTTDQDRSEERLVALAAHDLDQVAIRKIIDHSPKNWTSAASRSDLRIKAQCVSQDGTTYQEWYKWDYIRQCAAIDAYLQDRQRKGDNSLNSLIQREPRHRESIKAGSTARSQPKPAPSTRTLRQDQRPSAKKRA